MPANSNKRSTSGEWNNNGEGSSSASKRVRFGGDRDGSGSLEDIDDSDLLEQRKTRRGGVTVVEYNEGEESSDDEEFNKKKEKLPIDEIAGNKAGRAGEEAEEEEEDMFADPEEIEMRKAERKKKSAARDKGKDKNINWSEIGEDLNLNELDEDDYDSEGNLKIEAFNIKHELEEEGEIDEAGNFIRKLDPDRFHDSWLEGVSRKEIMAAHKAHERKEQLARIEEQQAAANAMSETDVYLELVNILKPGETVIEALQRQGGGKKTGNKGTKHKKKAWQKNAKPEEEAHDIEANLESEEEVKRRKSIEKLTDLCDRMMARGHFDIYEETYEQIVRNLRRADIIPDDWVIGTPVLRPGEQTEAMLEDDPLFSTDVSWEYKWANPSEGQSAEEIFGPFSGPEMKSWNEQGFFSQGILARRVGDRTFEPASSGTFE
ncbi:hypothetical protein BGX21_000863 [Mortierella sp. AD011]|nr:hypothetical protein BGX20_009008 [Mortierella sp. AD010]KAF9386193.1 hypothetical protein BGX21_000863 [Mortierella sp. AD011]